METKTFKDDTEYLMDSGKEKKLRRTSGVLSKRRCLYLLAISLLLLASAFTVYSFLSCHHYRLMLIDVESIPHNTPTTAPHDDTNDYTSRISTEELPEDDVYVVASTPTEPKAKENLVKGLEKLVFKNYGIVHSTDKFSWKSIPCHYLEPQNVSGPYQGWAELTHCNYLHRQIGVEQVHPTIGMRSSVPLGGISTGSFELRVDGTFHEWTIFNQHPGGEAKTPIFKDVFLGVRTQVDEGESLALALQTSPSEGKWPGVEALEYSGSYPVSKLTVQDPRLPIDMSVYAYSWYKHNDMNTSATPAVAFTAVLHNPTLSEVNASFMMHLPVGIEPNTQRSFVRMPVPVNDPVEEYNPQNIMTYEDIKDTLPLGNVSIISFYESTEDPLIGCLNSCKGSCLSWSFEEASRTCYLHLTHVRLGGHKEGWHSGVKASWSQDSDCLTLNRDTTGFSTNGNMSLCAFSSDDNVITSLDFGNNVTSLWSSFASAGQFSSTKKCTNCVAGAAAGQVTLKPGETKEVTLVLGWYFPEREFLGKPVGNFYSHLVKDSAHAARHLAKNLQEAVSDAYKLHSTFFDSQVPETFQDMLINSLSHIRSAFWLEDGRWRQWEAFDCVNIDSVHNDGERHIPYFMIFPDSVFSKMRAWAKYQLSSGMIQEELRCGCWGLPLSPPKVEFGCGRSMSDVSSMFIVYLLEILQWHPDNTSNDLVRELWPNARKAAEWQMSSSAEAGIPQYLWTTYDVLDLAAYPYVTYSGAFHLLAMKAAEKLAIWMNDEDFAYRCNQAFLDGQNALDNLLWNDTGKYYNAYSTTQEQFDEEVFFQNTDLNFCEYPEYWKDDGGECVEGYPATPGAIMTDTFYAQVLAYSLGLGTLVKDVDKLRSHMRAELNHNSRPHGMLVLTGRYPQPAPYTDNCVWMMGNANWATINLHLGEDVEEALEVGMQPFEHWRTTLNDIWNVAGILHGVGVGDDVELDNLPYVSSHYGFYMSSWHIVLALSGQQFDMNTKMVSFSPKVKLPFKLPVMIPTVWGSLQGELAPKSVSDPSKGYVEVYTLSLEFGKIEFADISVGDCKYNIGDNKLVTLHVKPLRWSCP